MTVPEQNKLIFYGVLLGVFQSLFGSLFFEGVVLLEEFFRKGPFSIYKDQLYSPFKLTNIISLSILPSILVSMTLLAWLIKSSQSKSVSAKGLAARGWLLGLCSGIGMDVFAYILFLHGSAPERFLFLNIIGLLAASLSSMLTGYLFSKLEIVRSVINKVHSLP